MSRSFSAAVLLPSVLSLFAVTAIACSEEGLAFTPPYLSSSTETLDFGEHVVGTSDQRTVFLINKGEVPLKLDLPRYDTLNDVFGVQLDGFDVDPNKDVVLAVRFRPAHAQTYSTTVAITNNSSNRPDFLIRLTGKGINPGPCDGVDCRRPPPPTCVGETTTRRYEPLGTCEEGRCVHEFRDEECMFGCDDTTGACRGDPCVGMACNTPPNSCYLANGECRAGACHFEVNNAGQCDDGQACTLGDHCSEGTCLGTTRTCTTPPSALCLDASTRRVFNPQGACNAANGACDYGSQDQHCEFGCTPEGCRGDPCANVVCNTPPASQCYQSMGTCANGVCTYGTVAGACDDGDPCTTGDACSAGQCAGTPMVCNTPPAADCPNASERRVYNAVGACMNGVCEYGSTTLACNDNNACTTSDVCTNGMCMSSGAPNCADSNACTADACDPIAGCVHTPSSGNACVSSSAQCPTGSCASGTCLPTAGVACVARYRVDLCQEVQAAGVCSASGQCVVSRAPPGFTCPGCNGICLVCFGIQLCLPF